MSVNLRFPNITASTEKEQLAQIKSYLHQLVEQLNYALPAMGTGSAQTIEVQGGEMSYYELRSLIIQNLQEVERRFEQLSAKVETDIEETLTEAKESGEFDGPQGPKGDTGPQGPQGIQGEKGTTGKDGFSPIVEVTDIEGGHRVTITDATSTNSFDVLNGNGSTTDSATYVTEAGSGSGWEYKKWNNGTYEMFGEFTVTTTTICTDMGSMFRSEEFSLPTPFAIDGAIVSGSADDLFLVASGGRASVDADTNIGFVLLRPFSFDANLEIIVRLHVTGTYHQGGTE